MANKFRYNMTYSANKFQFNNLALRGKVMGLFFSNNKDNLTTKERCIILYILSMFEKKNSNLSVVENENMHAISNCIATKYKIKFDPTITEARRHFLLEKYQNHIDEIYTTLEPSIIEIYLKNLARNQNQI